MKQNERQCAGMGGKEPQSITDVQAKMCSRKIVVYYLCLRKLDRRGEKNITSNQEGQRFTGIMT